MEERRRRRRRRRRDALVRAFRADRGVRSVALGIQHCSWKQRDSPPPCRLLAFTHGAFDHPSAARQQVHLSFLIAIAPRQIMIALISFHSRLPRPWLRYAPFQQPVRVKGADTRGDKPVSFFRRVICRFVYNRISIPETWKFRTERSIIYFSGRSFVVSHPDDLSSLLSSPTEYRYTFIFLFSCLFIYSFAFSLSFRKVIKFPFC